MEVSDATVGLAVLEGSEVDLTRGYVHDTGVLGVAVEEPRSTLRVQDFAVARSTDPRTERGHAIQVANGASLDGTVVQIARSSVAALVVDGVGSSAILNGASIVGEASSNGDTPEVGVSVQDGAGFELVDGTIAGHRDVGLVSLDSRSTLTDLSIADIGQAGGTGIGLALGGNLTTVVADITVARTSGCGVHLLTASDRLTLARLHVDQAQRDVCAPAGLWDRVSNAFDDNVAFTDLQAVALPVPEALSLVRPRR
jgi:hypothetical protein